MKKLEIRNWKFEVRKNLRFFLLIFSLFLIPCTLFPNFIAMNHGARAYSLGNAYIALADEPTAIFWNPAGISKINKLSLTISHQNLYGISDLFNEMASIVVPLKIAHFGLGWTQQNLLGEYYEQIIYLSGSKKVQLMKIPVFIGLNLKHFYANADYENAKAPSKFDLDFGMIIQPQKSLFIGFSTRNLWQRSFGFFDSDDKLYREYTIGACYDWQNIVNFVMDYVWDKDESQINLGGEMWFYDIFAPRIGMSGENLTAGFGIKTKNWNLDGAVFAHEQLGSTYRLSFGMKFDVFNRKQ